MIATDIAGKIRRQIGDHVTIENGDGGTVDVSTPFLFADGDHYGFTVLRDPESGRWLFSDDGEVLEKARLSGVDLLSQGRVGRLTHALEFYGIKERDGELFLPVRESDFGKAFFLFTQACMEISRLTALPARRAKIAAPRGEVAATVERLVKLAAPKVAYQRQWHHPEYDPHGIYGVDFRIVARTRPLLLFAPETDVACLQATVACQHYRQMRLEFDGMAVTDESRLAQRNIIALRDATGDHLAVDNDDELVEYLRSKVA